MADDGEEFIGAPVGGVPEAVATSLTEPWERSAWVTVYVPEQTSVAPGPSEELGHAGPEVSAAPERACASVTLTPVSGTGPVLETTNLCGPLALLLKPKWDRPFFR